MDENNNQAWVWVNKFFEIRIYQPKLITTQIAILLGLSAITLFSKESAVHRFCIVMLIIDILANLFVLISTSCISNGTEATDNSEAPAEVIHKKADKKDEKPARKPKENVITNKVPVPVPTEKKTEEQATPEVDIDDVSINEDCVPDVSVPKFVTDSLRKYGNNN